MKRLLLRSAIVVVVGLGLTLPVLADTIRLKDGSVLRGEIVNFRNEQFTILVGSGARGRKSRITVYMEDVESIEFEGAPADEANNTSNTPSQPTYQPPANTRPANNPPPRQPADNPNTSSNPTFFPVNVRVRADNSTNGWTNSGGCQARSTSANQCDRPGKPWQQPVRDAGRTGKHPGPREAHAYAAYRRLDRRYWR